MRLIRRYLIAVGLLAHLVPLAAAAFVMQHYQLTVQQLVIKGIQRTGMNPAWVEALLAPSPRHGEHALDGRIRTAHPRLFRFPGTDGPMPDAVAGKARLALFGAAGIGAPKAQVNCSANASFVVALCWAYTANAAAARRGIDLLAREIDALTVPQNALSVGRSTGHWRLALAYDFLYGAPSMTDAARRRIEQAFARAVRRYLSFLDGDELSLWHSRASVAAEAWFMAVVLDTANPDYRDLARRTQAYFLDAIDALELTGAWPEGYNYWINNRALLMALGAAAYVNALDGANRTERVRRTLHEAALWSIYASRPDGRVEGLGDEGPRVDQKDETRRFIDLVAQLTRDGALAAYSTYLERLYGDESYYRAYRWALPLLNDPTVRPSAGIPERDLGPVGHVLPSARLFGRNALNLAFIRSGWGADDTMIGFRAGASFSHHGHYDAGHFSLFKGAPLAVSASRYFEFFDRLRLDFALRTVAKNSILILRPGEEVAPSRFFENNVAAGGQRLTLATGSALRDVRQWRDNLNAGLHLEGGDILGWHHEPGAISYAYADIGSAYNRPDFDAGGSGGKALGVSREIAYLHGEDILLVRDRIAAVAPEYTQKWLMHTVVKPRVDGLELLRGEESDGILQSKTANRALVENGRGRLVLQKLVPSNGMIRLVGGESHRYYVEADGDDRDLDGLILHNRDSQRQWFDDANWRIEIQAPEPGAITDFLIALLPSVGEYRTDRVLSLRLEEGRGYAVETPRSAVVFAEPTDRTVRFEPSPGVRRIYVLGLADGAVLVARAADGREIGRAVAAERAAALTAPAGLGGSVSLTIDPR